MNHWYSPYYNTAMMMQMYHNLYIQQLFRLQHDYMLRDDPPPPPVDNGDADSYFQDEPSYTPSFGGISPGSIAFNIQKCGGINSWIYIYLKEKDSDGNKIPGPQKFWFFVEYYDGTTVSGYRIKKNNNKKVKVATSIDIENIITILCYDDNQDTGTDNNQDTKNKCQDGKGDYLGGETINVWLLSIKYEVYECGIYVTPRLLGVSLGTSYLKREGGSIVYKQKSGFDVYKVVIWIEGNNLKIRAEHRIFGHTTRLGPWTVGIPQW